MSGYRRVNYYELCRLCTSSEGSKMSIFREEGRRRQLQTKIQMCLPIQVLEEDSLPKVVCHECVKKLESYMEFRETVVSAEGMLESYFTSLRFSEDFLKEGKVYVKNTGKERPMTPEIEVLKCIEKTSSTTGSQILNNEQQIQTQQSVTPNNISTSNIQIISGVQSRVQQYKCAMQMQPGGMAATVVEATAETHYSYQQQTSQQVSPQSNETQNQIAEQQNQTSQIHQVQNQIQSHNQINQVSSQQQISQQLNQTPQISQQNQSQINQQQGQSQITHQIQQLQRQREYEKQHRQLQQIEKQQIQIASQDFAIKQESSPAQVVHQNNNVLKPDTDTEQTQQIIQKTEPETQKDENSTQNLQNYTTVQATSEVFLNLGFKEASLGTQTVRDNTKNSSDDGGTRNSIGHISEFLRIRPGPEQTSLITVNPQVISQPTRNAICRDCGKTFSSLDQLNNHNCGVQSLMSDGSEVENKDDPLSAANASSFNCDVCLKPFKRKEHLYQHRKLHTGERPYVCTTCTKAFSRKEHLVRHSVSHTGQKMHECEMCRKSFSRKDNLHKHRKTHGVSGPYVCETCGKSFVVKHYYLMHLTTHASLVTDGDNCQDPLPYKCDICHKAFSVKQYLSTHKLRHRSKNNNSNAQNTLNMRQQTQQSATSNSVNAVINDVTNSANLNNNNNNNRNNSSSNNSNSSNSNNSNNNNNNNDNNDNNNGGQTNSGSTVEMQSVIERSEQSNSSFANSHYHNSIQEFQ